MLINESGSFLFTSSKLFSLCTLLHMVHDFFSFWLSGASEVKFFRAVLRFLQLQVLKFHTLCV